MNPKILQLSSSIAIVAVLFTISFIPVYRTGRLASHELSPRLGEDGKQGEPTSITSPLLDLEAKSVLVIDLVSNEILYEKNMNIVMPLASVTKLATVAAVSQIIVNPDLEIKNSIQQALVYSSNEAARDIAIQAGKQLLQSYEYSGFSAQEAFVRYMNKMVQVLDMRSSFFINPTGEDETTLINGGYSTAQDIAILLRFLMKEQPDLIRISASQYSPIRFSKGVVPNTNTGIGSIMNIIGSKTGFTDIAGGNLVVIFEPELLHPVAIIILGSGKESRFIDMQEIINSLWKN